jgi:hypothetical protein
MHNEMKAKLVADFPFIRINEPEGIFMPDGWYWVIRGCLREIADYYKKNDIYIELEIAPSSWVDTSKNKFESQFFPADYILWDESWQRLKKKFVKKWNIVSNCACEVCGNAAYIRKYVIPRTLCGACFIDFIAKEKPKWWRWEDEEAPLVLTANKANDFAGEHIVIPDGYRIICERAFRHRTDIKSISIPASVGFIEYQAFPDSIKSFRVDESHEHFSSGEDGVLYQSILVYGKERQPPYFLIKYPVGKEEESFAVPDGIHTIGIEAFMSSRLKSVTFPDSLGKIDAAAFSDCYRLEEINLPKGIQTIHDTAFRKCGNLKNISISEDASEYTCVDGVLFNKDKTVLLKYPAKKPQSSYIIPDGVLVIGATAFSECENLKSVIIPEGVMIIGNGAFAGCAFEDITLPEGLKSIGYHAFEGCRGLREITLPKSVTHIVNEAFACCDAKIKYMAVGE